MSPKVRKIVFRSLISLALMAGLVYKIDLPQIIRTFGTVNLRLYALATVLFVLQQVAVAYCWQILLDAQQSQVPFSRVLKIHFVGTFFGVFMPTSIGMDVVRAFSLSRHMRKGVNAATSMFVSRAVGYLVFFAMAILVAIPVSYGTGNSLLFWLVLGLTLAFVGSIWILLHPRFLKIAEVGLKRLRLERLVNKLEEFQQGTQVLHQNRSLMVRLLVFSAFYQVLGIFIIFMVGKSLAISVGLQNYFIYVPLIMAITILPLSIAGIGVREGAFVFFFTPLGVAQARALSLSLLLFMQMIFVAALGGVLYWAGGTGPAARTKSYPIRAEEEPVNETE